jgi:hypothetical protein
MGAMTDKTAHALEKGPESRDVDLSHFARRGEGVDDVSSDQSDIVGFDAERMKARTLLTEAEEKKLMRRIDWHLMPLCSLMFLLKNIDYNNVSASRLPCPRSLTTLKGCQREDHEQGDGSEHLDRTWNELRCLQSHHHRVFCMDMSHHPIGEADFPIGAIYCFRSTVQSLHQTCTAFEMAITDHGMYVTVRLS